MSLAQTTRAGDLRPQFRLLDPGAVFFRSRERVGLVVAAVALGVLVARFQGPTLAPIGGAFVLATILVAPLAFAKAATACGLNSLGSFVAQSRPRRTRLLDWAIYLGTSTASGAVLGALLGALSQLTRVPAPLVGVVLAYLGLRELGILRPSPPLASRWQVPARWVTHPRRAAFVWGFWLGPGIATQMPHAVFYGVLLLAAMGGWPTSIWLLGAYGTLRAVPALVVVVLGAGAQEWMVGNAYRVRLLGHALVGTMAIAIGAALVTVAWS